MDVGILGSRGFVGSSLKAYLETQGVVVSIAKNAHMIGRITGNAVSL